MSKPVCFVIMGFGLKTDHELGKTYDLDKTYKSIIQPAVEELGYQVIRADEIMDAGLIDRSMYALLMKAELVVADISTFNPNAIYELGVRHALRPRTTIVLKEQEGRMQFDLNHTRMVTYRHLGEGIDVEEAEKTKARLRDTIQHVIDNELRDSPLYEYIPDITPPTMSDAVYQQIVGELAEKGESIFALSEAAKILMAESKFKEAIPLWQKASELIPSEAYFVQQLSLATYKSKAPSEMVALVDAQSIIQRLHEQGKSNDPETLGITGAINKRLWVLTHELEYLNRARRFYEKGYQIKEDFYNGENLALCLNYLQRETEDSEEQIYYRMDAKKVREAIIASLAAVAEELEQNPSFDNRWIAATLANCYLGLGDIESSQNFERIFFNLTGVGWEFDTYNDSKAVLQGLLGETNS